MLDIFRRMFDPSGFPPRWRCGIWSEELGWLHIVSDLFTWAAYVTIPLVLGYLVLRRRDMPFPRVFWLFAVFILACGTVHLIDAIIFWWPVYRFMGIVKCFTAIVSWTTVIALVPVMRRVLLLRNPEEVEELNQNLRQQVSEQLQATERLRMFLEAAPDCMLVVNRCGDIIFANSQAEELFQTTTENLLSTPLEGLLPARFRKQHCLQREIFFAGPHRRPMGAGRELFALRKDGCEIAVEISLSPVQLEGELVVIAAVRDITCRKVVEKQLREQQEKLLQSERLAAVGETVLCLAHESRNALQRAQAGLGLLEHGVDNTERNHKLLERIQQALNDLRHMFDQLRAYTTPRKLEKELISLSELVMKTWNELPKSRKLQLAKLQIHSQLEDDRCYADPFALRQVFRNLLENSLQASERSLQEDVYLLPADDGREETHRIVFCDNGPGFGGEHEQHVFDPFFTTKKRGIGLGLSISQSIVEAHGGDIRVSHARSFGAEIVVCLPIGVQTGELAYE